MGVTSLCARCEAVFPLPPKMKLCKQYWYAADVSELTLSRSLYIVLEVDKTIAYIREEK